MIDFLILIIAVIIIGSVYTILYYRRFNKVVNDINVSLYKLTPSILTLSLVFVALVSGLTYSFVDVNALEKRVAELEEIVVESQYSDELFMNSDLEFIYTSFNLYFGGHYYEDGNIIICVRDDAPQELIDYIEDNNIQFELVKFNYSDLLQLNQMIVNLRTDDTGIMIVYIDIKLNKVVISTNNIATLIEKFQAYIDEGVLEIRYGGEIDYK